MKNIPVANPCIGEKEARAVYKTVRDGWVSMGKKVEEFERAFAQYLGIKHAIAVSNGTTALHLALIASGITEGDEVLVPDITFISTANAVLYERAIPVLVECDPRTYNISLGDARRRITKKTKAIIPVDMNGMPADYDRVLAFAQEFKLKVIADSAESLGAIYKGRKVGAISEVHIFSFFPNKNITTGEGGMITTKNDKIAVLTRQLRNQGQDYRYHHIHLGYNYRMTDIPATIGIEQLKKIEDIVSKKEKIALRYSQALKDSPDISAPFIPEYVDRHSWYMYAISLRRELNRDKVAEELKKRGIDTRLSFPPIHTQPYYQKMFGYNNNSYPVSLEAWKQLIDLPIWPGLPIKDQDCIIESLKDIVRRMSK
jgi:perosamine synthetase